LQKYCSFALVSLSFSYYVPYSVIQIPPLPLRVPVIGIVCNPDSISCHQMHSLSLYHLCLLSCLPFLIPDSLLPVPCMPQDCVLLTLCATLYPGMFNSSMIVSNCIEFRLRIHIILSLSKILYYIRSRFDAISYSSYYFTSLYTFYLFSTFLRMNLYFINYALFLTLGIKLNRFVTSLKGFPHRVHEPFS